MQIRHASRSDYAVIKPAITAWWSESHTPEQARELSMLFPPLFLQHFASTSWIAEDESGLAGFVVGFHSADHADEAYIHLTGVNPRLRGRGVARTLYDRFFEQARAAGRTTVRAVTSPHNTGSIGFHTSMGFAVAPGDTQAGGVSVHSDYDGPGLDRVCFVRRLG